MYVCMLVHVRGVCACARVRVYFFLQPPGIHLDSPTSTFFIP